ncbi:unnamed protein product [Caenorhabditis bovis]|uniref:MH2 domain-containing protein n=1 Tax=Caenorhabditis bovis TaxID=2654633 RepID=A0A8S1FB39_9PELO|nr:unnamed protein product [Caenorhabditis bovis]
MESGVSRSSLVHGTKTNPNSDTWYDTDAFLLDQVKEVLNKLNDGSIDDEIWGKIVIMERCKRVAKAYLRKTTVIIDGSEDEFDGKTLGFNHFENSTRDEYTQEIRAKINDGVILKMDYQGNIKGMARGATPIICQGWKDTRTNCISDRLVRLHGKLNHGASEDEKAYKVFDMRKFKHSLEREIHDGNPDAKALLLKTCVRIALVKDGADMARTPCWFAVVNLVALDMLKEKIPDLFSILNGSTLSKATPVPQDSLDTQTLTQIIAAAVTQANKGLAVPATPTSLSISPEQLAQIASTISIAQTNTMRTADLTTMNKKERKKTYHCSTSSLDSSGEDSSGQRSECNPKMRVKRWEQNNLKVEKSDMEKVLEKSRVVRPHRPLLQDVIFTRSHSITSDYDSNKEHFDSGSWSSTQSRSQYKGSQSTASSVVSDHEISALAREELKESSEIREANSTSEESSVEPATPSPAPSVKLAPTLPRKDYESAMPEETEIMRTRHNSIAPLDFTPKLEGPKEWKPSLNHTRIDHSPPPPLPKTPQPSGQPIHQNYNTFHSNPSFYDSHDDVVNMRSQLRSRNGPEMEIYFGRVARHSSDLFLPTQQHQGRANPFVSELRQVLAKRTNGLRVARNHSQPAAAHPNLRQFTNNYQTSTNGRCTPPERAQSQLIGCQYPRGLRRTTNMQLQPSHQQPQSINYGQSILCRDENSTRVNRTGSLPWGQWQHMRRTHM